MQPVLPFTVNDDWNLIARVIVPFVGQPPLFEGGVPAFGVSDVLASFFFSPSRGALIWGVGPVISLPSTTMPTLGTEKWSTGPTVVVLKQTGPWTVGALWNQVWSFSGNEAREDVSQMFLQPFLSYQATRTLTLTLQSETTANWEVDENRWTAHPEVGPSWKVRGAIVILLPRR
ncbi:MAG TPA: hypothetical protein VFB92_08845 [Vicinamibacterales bacterium]|nr:hypothetical protein [Vicinamibacterales bacterium]